MITPFFALPIRYTLGGTGLTSLGTAGQVLTVNPGATAIEWAAGGGGGIKQAYNQGIPPTVNNDSTQGYAAGSRWYGNNGGEWFCIDASVGAAVWYSILDGKWRTSQAV